MGSALESKTNWRSSALGKLVSQELQAPAICSNMVIAMFAIGITFLVGCGTGYPTASNRATPSAGSESFTQVDSNFNTEAYDVIVENSFVDALLQPQSTFAVDVDTASYSNVRRILSAGKCPPPGAVRLEELVNYFNYDYPEPSDAHPFSVSTDVAACPWNDGHQLLRVGLKGRSIDAAERAPANLVFLLDVSGSMQAANKLPLVQTSLRLMTDRLNESDRVAIVVYAGTTGLVLDSTSERNAILDALDQLEAGGSTNGGQGIHLAYRIANENRIDGGINRVILCTDGDFNVGTTNASELVELITKQALSNVFLTVLGFGDGNLKDSTMEKLADHGNGNYAYIDNLLEARKVLVEQIGATLETIAKDVKIQIDFNPQHVQSYRLLGYENRMLENRDFRDDGKDAGEIGAGHCVTAFYELIPAGKSSSSPLSRASEFVVPSIAAGVDSQAKLTVNLRYKLAHDVDSQEFQVRVPESAIASASTDFNFATAVLSYGMLLRRSEYAGTADWDWTIETAADNLGPDPQGLRAEFLQLAKYAQLVCK